MGDVAACLNRAGSESQKPGRSGAQIQSGNPAALRGSPGYSCLPGFEPTVERYLQRNSGEG